MVRGVCLCRSDAPPCCPCCPAFVVWQVRQEHAMLDTVVNREDSVLPMSKGVSEALDLASSRGYISDWDGLSLRNLSTRHPALPPSALGGCTSRLPTRADVPVEVITNQMAGILRAVEAKVRRIEVSDYLVILACTQTPQTLANSQARNSVGITASLSSPPFVRLLNLTRLENKRMQNLRTPRMTQLNRHSHRLANSPHLALWKRETRERAN